MTAAQSAVVVVDVQERLSAAMPPDQVQQVERAAKILLEAARLLGATVLYTEQYPKGLGATLPQLRAQLAAVPAQRFEKTNFSAWQAEGLADALASAAPRVVVVLGMEAHVCVYQTVRDLAAHGFEVHVPIDGVASRRQDHRETGLQLCERVGAVRTTAETVAFDWLGSAGSPEFKAVSGLIR